MKKIKKIISLIIGLFMICSCTQKYSFNNQNYTDANIGIWTLSSDFIMVNDEDMTKIAKLLGTVKYKKCEESVSSDISSSSYIVGFADESETVYIYGVCDNGKVYMQEYENKEVLADYESAGKINYNKYLKIYKDSSELKRLINIPKRDRMITLLHNYYFY